MTKITDTAIHTHTRILNSVEETFAIGKNIAELAQKTSTRLILLYGALGSGKTSFTRGFVSAFKNADLAEVSSPTFTLVNHYPTSPAIIHADIYRLAEMADFSLEDAQDENSQFPTLELPEEVEEILYDTTDTTSYTLIEWADFLDPNELTKERLDIFLEISDTGRTFRVFAYTEEIKDHLIKLDK